MSLKKLFSFLLSFLLLFQGNAPYLVAFAQEVTDSTPSAEIVVEPTPIPTPAPEWQTIDDADVTTTPVAEGRTYKYRDTAVTITFTKVTQPAPLKIKQVQVGDATGYDITSDMPDGTFTYDLTLPNPNPSQEATVQYSEDGQTYQELPAEEQNNVFVIKGLDHFTIFVVTTTADFAVGTSTGTTVGTDQVTSALGPLVLDQSQTAGTTAVTFNSTSRTGQIFTAGSSGFLAQVILSLRVQTGDDKSGNITLRVKDVVGGLPGPTVLAETTVDPNTVPNVQGDVTFSYSSPATLTAGTQYALVIFRSGTSNTNMYDWYRSTSDTYPGGTPVNSTNSGSTWTIGTNDRVFSTYEQTYVSSGTQASDVLDTGTPDTKFQLLTWIETLPSGTNVTFEVRALSTAFLKDDADPAWTSLGTGDSPQDLTSVLSGTSRYFQWRATFLATATETPVLEEVTVDYAPTVVWVDDDFVPNSYDKFTNIRDGVDAVAAGGTVNIADGTYADPITIVKSGLTISCNSNINTIINTGNSSTGISLLAGADNVTIINCLITGNGDGISLDSVSGTAIQDNVIDNNTFSTSGIYILDSSSVSITDNTISNNEVGVDLIGSSSGVTLSGNTFTTNSSYDISDNTNNDVTATGNTWDTISGIFVPKIFDTDTSPASGFAGQVIFDLTNPSVDAGIDKITNTTFTQDATATDDYGIASFLWEKVTGPGNINFSDATIEDPEITVDADGIYDIKLTATDTSGNQFSDIFQLTRNIVAPTVGAVTLATDYDPYVRGNSFTIRANVSDSAPGLDTTSCEYTIDGINWNPASYVVSPSRCRASSLSASDGANLTLNLRVKDLAGNIATGVAISRISDRAIPVASGISISPDVSGYTSGTPTVTATITDSVSPITACEYRTRITGSGAAGWSAWASATWFGTCSASPTGLTDNTSYDFQIRGDDSTNHTSSSTVTAGNRISRTVDASVPSAPGTPITIPNPTLSSSQTWNWPAASDSLSDILGYQYRVTGDSVEGPTFLGNTLSYITTFGQGIYNFFVSAKDNVGNIGPESNSTLTVDQTNPTVSADNSSLSWYASSPAITLSVSDSGESGLSFARYNWNTPADATTGTTFDNNDTLTIPSPGSHDLYLYAEDNAGNSNTWSGPYKLDIDIPSSVPISPASGYYNAATWPGKIEGTATDNTSSVTSVEVSMFDGTNYWNGADWTGPQIWFASTGTDTWDYSYIPSKDGEFTFYSRATDSASNVESTGTLSGIFYDTTPPTLEKAETQDSEHNGHIDAVKLTFSEPIDDSRLEPGADGWDVADPAGAEQITSGSGVNDRILILNFGEGPTPDTANTPSVTYASSDGERSTYDLAGNELVGDTWPTTDLAEPAIISAVTRDTDPNGRLDTIEVRFSEPIDDELLIDEADHWTVSDDYTVSSVDSGATANDDTILLHLTEKSVNDTGTMPDVSYSRTGGETSVHDQSPASNELVDTTWEETSDGANPEVAWTTPAANTTISGTAALSVAAKDDNMTGIKSTQFQYRADGEESFHDIAGSSWNTTSLALGKYILRVIVTDNADNVTTIDEPIYVAAVISNIYGHTIDTTRIEITWNTDRPTDGRIIYDTLSHGSVDPSASPNYGYASSTGTEHSVPDYGTSHAIVVGGLSSNMGYYWRIVSAGTPVVISAEGMTRTYSEASAGGGGGGGGGNPTVNTPPAVPPAPAAVLGVATEEIEETEEEILSTPTPTPTPTPQVRGTSTFNFNWWLVIIPTALLGLIISGLLLWRRP